MQICPTISNKLFPISVVVAWFTTLTSVSLSKVEQERIKLINTDNPSKYDCLLTVVSINS